MVRLADRNLKEFTRQSSKGNQLKWEKEGIWYKADYTGYEGLSEYIVSALLKHSSLQPQEYVPTERTLHPRVVSRILYLPLFYQPYMPPADTVFVNIILLTRYDNIGTCHRIL